jgi:hypothetical protein
MKTNNWLSNCYTKEEEISIYDEQLQDILDNTSWYLENLDYLLAYRVFWGDYSTNRAVIPKQKETFIKNLSPINKAEQHR